MYIYRVLARNYHRKKKLKGYRGGVYGIHTSSASEKKNSQLIKIWNKKKGMELFARSKFGVKLVVCDFNSEQQKNEATMNMFADAYIISKH